MGKKEDKPTGEYKISRTKGFSDGIVMCRYNSDSKFFNENYFNVLSCSCQDYSSFKKEGDFSGTVLLTQYIAAIKRINDYAKENGLHVVTEELGSNPIWYYREFNIANPPKYLERKVVRLFGKPNTFEDKLMIRSITLDTAAYHSGLHGHFNIGIPVRREDLFNSLVDSVKTLSTLPSPKEFKEMLLDIHTDKDLGIAQEILGSMGFENTNSLLFH
jgi:hypothetical protein